MLVVVSTMVVGEAVLNLEIVFRESGILATAVVGDFDAEALVAVSTVVAVRVLLVWEVFVGVSVTLETAVGGGAVDVAVLVFSTVVAPSTVLGTDSEVVEGEALLAWEVVIGEPFVISTALDDVTIVTTPFVDFFTLVSSEVILVLGVLFGASVSDIEVAPLVVFTVVVADTVLRKLLEDLL